MGLTQLFPGFPGVFCFFLRLFTGFARERALRFHLKLFAAHFDQRTYCFHPGELLIVPFNDCPGGNRTSFLDIFGRR